jgi:hypothetical protein
MPLPDALLAAGKELMVEAIEMDRPIKLPSWDFARRKVGARKSTEPQDTAWGTAEYGLEGQDRRGNEARKASMGRRERKTEEERRRKGEREGGGEKESGERTTSVVVVLDLRRRLSETGDFSVPEREELNG